MSGSFVNGVRVRYDSDMSEAEALEFYRVLSDDPSELMQTRFAAIRAERRQEFATNAVRAWQEHLDKLRAHLGNAASGAAAEYLDAEQAQINEAWDVIPTL